MKDWAEIGYQISHLLDRMSPRIGKPKKTKGRKGFLNFLSAELAGVPESLRFEAVKKMIDIVVKKNSPVFTFTTSTTVHSYEGHIPKDQASRRSFYDLKHGFIERTSKKIDRKCFRKGGNRGKNPSDFKKPDISFLPSVVGQNEKWKFLLILLSEAL